jgi:DNA-binding NtrC family response regulator
MTAPTNSRETILIVEDQQEVRDVVRAILERAGFRVLTAGSGAEAIQVESVTKETIHLLLSDVMMPDLSGPAVATILKKLRPEMRVMLMSGYADGDMLFLNHGWHFIEKPFLPAALVERVTEVLHTSERGQGNYSYDTRETPSASAGRQDKSN